MFTQAYSGTGVEVDTEVAPGSVHASAVPAIVTNASGPEAAADASKNWLLGLLDTSNEALGKGLVGVPAERLVAKEGPVTVKAFCALTAPAKPTTTARTKHARLEESISLVYHDGVSVSWIAAL